MKRRPSFIAMLLVLTALVPFAFADTYFYPGHGDIGISATIDGRPVPDGTTVVMHCLAAHGAHASRLYECQNGVCSGGITNESPCADRDVFFEFSHPSFSRNYTTSSPVMLTVGDGRDYYSGKNYFEVRISSVSGTASIEARRSGSQPLQLQLHEVLIRAIANFIMTFPGAYMLTVLLETPIYWFFLVGYTKTEKAIALSLLINTLTLPVVWFVLPPFLFSNYVLYFVVAELFAWLSEALMVKLAFSELPWSRAVLAALAANAVSAGAGLLIAFFA